jgi:NAD(P)H-dependent FMN reductase
MVHISEHDSSKTVLVIMGSVRAGRHCRTISEWVVSVARACSNLKCELIDLADWHLPMSDEPHIPAVGGYIQPHTRAWSNKVASADAIIFVTPQYNWGYPAPLKNAIDHLYKEWNGKPAVIVTYGGHGGNKCAAQLRQVLEGLKMRAVATMPGFTLTDPQIVGGAIDPAKDFQPDAIRQAISELMALLETAAT